jgi:hypothetical protein
MNLEELFPNRRNWYALFICITKNKNTISSLKIMGVPIKHKYQGFKQPPTYGKDAI